MNFKFNAGGLAKYFSKELFLLVAILAAGIFFRFYNFSNRISMGLDSARDAFVALEGAKNLQFPLTGPFISIAPVTTGPWYWIQLIIARLLIPSSLAPWLLIAAYSTLMIFTMYKLGKNLEGGVLGLIAATISAISPYSISNAVGLTNPAVIGFYTSLVLLLFTKVTSQVRNYRLGFIWGLILGITINTHYQTAGLASLLILLVIFKRQAVKLAVYALLGIFTTFIPLVIFEFNNHWFNTSHMLNYILVDQYKIWTPMSWKMYISSFWPQFIIATVGGNQFVAFALMLLIFLLFLRKLITRQLSTTMVIILLSFVVQVVIIRYYRGERFFGYLQFFQPYLILFIGLVLYEIYKIRYIAGILVVSLYILLVFPSSIKSLEPEPLTAESKNLLVSINKTIGPPPYKLYICKGVLKPEIRALVLVMDMASQYDSSGKPLAYLWGCPYPDTLLDGTKLQEQDLRKPDLYYPGLTFIKDFSAASPSAILEKQWVENSPEVEYQSAARWWFDEQP